MHKIKYNLGFSLIEILVAVGVLAIVGVVITQILFLTTKSNNKTEILNEVKQNGDFALDLMTRMIRISQTVTSECTQSGTTTNSLTITNPDSLSTTFTCISDSGTFRLASSSGSSTAFLSSNKLAASKNGNTCGLQFVCKTVAGVPRSVKISFGLEQLDGIVDQSSKVKANFETSVTLRN